MILLNIGVLALVAWGAWWLTGLDKTAGGESKRTHYFFRAIRCAAIVWLAGVFLWFAEDLNGGYGGVALLLIIPPSLALLLRSAIAEFFTQGFLRLVDPTLHDDRPLDPGKSRRYMDAIARLIQNGQRAEAIRLCEQLKLSGEVDLVTLENTLEFLGVPQNVKPENPLSQAARLRADGKFAEAEKWLRSLLEKNPADVGAAMMLMRLCAQDLRQPEKAHEILRALQRQPHAPDSHIEFARRSIEEWSRRAPEKIENAAQAKAKSVDELLAQGFFGSAVEALEQQIKSQPDNFELHLKLAEVHAVNCKNLPRAEKIVRQMRRNFSPQQIELAQAKFAGWQTAMNQAPGAA
jgi:tetratricopeptide (TPR) repeat protein